MSEQLEDKIDKLIESQHKNIMAIELIKREIELLLGQISKHAPALDSLENRVTKLESWFRVLSWISGVASTVAAALVVYFLTSFLK